MIEYKVKEAREELGISQEELSRRSNVSRAMISKLESGKRVAVNTKTLEKIAIALEKRVSEIFLG